MMFKYKLLLFISILLISCNNKESRVSSKPNKSFEKLISRSLLNGYFKKINKNTYVSIYQNNIFLFSNAQDGFSKKEYEYNLIKSDGSIINKGLYVSETTIESSQKGIFKPLNIILKKENIDSFKSIEIVDSKSSWSYKIDLKAIFNKWSRYENEFENVLQTNLLQQKFNLALKNGVFFKNPYGFYILIYYEDLFFITDKTENTKDRFMLHLINKDNSFVNRSFNFKDANFSKFLEKPYSSLNISRVNIDSEELYEQIRIGQYNKDDNIWAQQFYLSELETNSLLRFNNEF